MRYRHFSGIDILVIFLFLKHKTLANFLKGRVHGKMTVFRFFLFCLFPGPLGGGCSSFFCVFPFSCFCLCFLFPGPPGVFSRLFPVFSKFSCLSCFPGCPGRPWFFSRTPRRPRKPGKKEKQKNTHKQQEPPQRPGHWKSRKKQGTNDSVFLSFLFFLLPGPPGGGFSCSHEENGEMRNTHRENGEMTKHPQTSGKRGAEKHPQGKPGR